RLHFVMTDNPSLSDEVIDRYEHMYSGVFYQRYILGQWVLADGIVYDNFNKDEMVSNPSQQPSRYYVSVDYGTQNPTVFLLWGKCGSVWYCLKEYYYDGRHSSRQKTD
ncbi:PBSX family phage terminase large subunit, partial [Lacticaseibacillus rhamnosus]|nr:PBSX family phage terminase large subunit [Lacticaseibacillus rhamnosus]